MTWAEVTGNASAVVRGTGDLPKAFGVLGVAVLLAPLRRLSPRASEYVITGCALWALVVPLVLWISWSRTGFLILVASAGIAIALIYLLIQIHPDDPF